MQLELDVYRVCVVKRDKNIRVETFGVNINISKELVIINSFP